MLDYYVASELGKRSFENEKVLHDVWNNEGSLELNFSNMTEAEIGTACVDVPLAVNGKCLSAGTACKGDKKCEAIFTKYVDALKKGYTKSFDEFKKESKLLGYITTGFGVIGGLFGDPNQAPDVPTKTIRETRIKWAVGIAVTLTLIGVGIYAYKKLKK